MATIGYIWSVLCLLLRLLVSVSAETDWEVAMVADVVHGMQRPSSVIAALCCPKRKQLQLYSALTNGEDNQISMVQFFQPGQLPLRFSESHHVVFLADLGCTGIHEHLKLSHSREYFRSPYRWILIGGSDLGNVSRYNIPEAMEGIDVLPDGEAMVAQRLKPTSYILFSIYKTGMGANWQKEFYATWDINRQIRKYEKLEEVTALRRKNLQKHEITASLVITNNDSLNHLLDGANDHIDTISKVNFPTIDHLMEYLNASKNYIFVDTWGYNYNGTWTGMCGLLVTNRAEIGGSPIFITKERKAAMDFISSPTPTEMKFVFIQPKLSYTQNLYLLSFSPAVWRCLLGLMFLMFLVLFAVARWEWKIIKCDSDGEEEDKQRALQGTDVALVVFGAICQQGSPVELKGSLGRVVTLLLFVTLMFIYTSYSANIVALLQSSSSQIRTLEDLLYSRLKLGADDTAYNKYFFSTAKKPAQKAVYQSKIAPPGGKPRYFSMEEGVKRIQQGLFAFHMEAGVGYKFVNKLFREGEKCNLQEIDFLQLPMPWQPVRKNTPYMEMYRIGFKRIKEAGLQSRQNVRLYDKRPVCSGRESSFVSVGLVDCYPALLELAYGMMISLFILTTEILLKKREQIASRICSKWK